jgi:hypothetical protein
MSRKVLIAFALVASVVPMAVVAQQAPAPADSVAAVASPTIDIPEKIKDFGTVPKGEKLKAVFDVRNTGTAPLEITQLRPTCGCTVADKPDKPIPAGGSGKIVAEVDTAGFNGPISKAVLVFSNDTKNPQVNLVIKGEVKAFVDVLPRPLLLFRSVLQGEAVVEKLKLVADEGVEFKVVGVDAGGGPYQLAYRELPEAERVADRKGSQWELTVTVPATAPEGLLNHKIVVKTTAPKAPEVTITAQGAVRPVIQAIPNEINFGKVSNEAVIGHNLLLINNRPEFVLKLSEPKIEDPDLSAKVTELDPGKRFQVAVSLKAGASKGTHKATLRIETNDSLRKLLEVPVQVVVQ